MGLQDVRYQEEYRSGHDNLVSQFFRPSLREAREYWRAVGYFSSSAFESFGTPLGEFAANGGSIRLVTSVELSEADLQAIKAGMAKREVCAGRLLRIVEEDFAEGVGDGTVRLIRLLESGQLEIRIAVPTNGTGIYHEKIGLFLNGSDYIAFTGSSNESRNAFENNRECIDVFASWKVGDSAGRALRKRQHFEALWNSEDDFVEVYSFPEAAKSRLIRICGRQPTARPSTDGSSRRWRHQDEAVEVFLAEERGVLDMATGTGKTRTALKILEALFNRDVIDSVIISTHGTDLLDQWFLELLAAVSRLPAAPIVYRHYGGIRECDNFTLDSGKRFLLVSRQFCAKALRELTVGQASRTLIVHDEVHGLGSEGNRQHMAGLSENIRYRLGLSATPEREYDADGNLFITEHIGPVLMTFGLEEAITRGVLAPFDYYPLRYELTDFDRERIAAIIRRKNAQEEAGAPIPDELFWTQIANVYKTSPAKLPIFDEFISTRQHLLKRCIVFTGNMDYGRQVLEIIHKYRADIHTYFSGEEAETLRRFAEGDLECLVSCHRLSEGIDIQSLRTVILFSSAKARLETIQRLGRCLRVNPENPDKVAQVVDFIREDNKKAELNTDEKRREWLASLAKLRPEE
ncbi:MAG: DEAD/DEAH box helicase family protein [Gammaproteobacteria bacterium]|nr:DEAD/DEAH box helicase family protein [Gammaproteobacteria bacterium]